MKKQLLFSLLFGIFLLPAYSQTINEFHYANTDETGTGFVEVLVPDTFTTENLGAITLTLYKNSDADVLIEMDREFTLDEFGSRPGSSYNGLKVLYLNITAGLPDPIGGISLSSDDSFTITVHQFLSYGSNDPIVAENGPAAGKRSTPIKVTEKEEDGEENAVFLPENSPEWADLEGGTDTKGYRNGRINDPLPVELIYFTGKQITSGVLLTWATAMEKNNDKFVVERSNELETKFTAIAEIKGQGSILQEQQYQFIDFKPVTGTTFYRLKQVDLDGTASYFKIIAITPKEVDHLLVYPNPTTSNMLVAFRKETGGTIQIFNKMGQMVYQKELGGNLTNATNLQLDKLPAGTYILILERDKNRQSKAFVKL